MTILRQGTNRKLDMTNSSKSVASDCELCRTGDESCSDSCEGIESCDECVPCDDEHCAEVPCDNEHCAEVSCDVQMQARCCDQVPYCCGDVAPPCTLPDCTGWDDLQDLRQACYIQDCTTLHNPKEELWDRSRVQGAHLFKDSQLQDQLGTAEHSLSFEHTFCRANDCGIPHYDNSELQAINSGSQTTCTLRHGSTSTDSTLSHLATSPVEFTANPLLRIPSPLTTDLGHLGVSPLDPFHCHWNDCDLSFLNSWQFDQHFLTDHLKHLHHTEITKTKKQAQSLDDALWCAWDRCQMAQSSAPALFDHVKQDHVAAEEHYRCKWLIADSSGNIEPCNICFSSADQLTQHVSTDHIGSRQKEYTCYWQDCERCNRAFTQRQKILRHIVVHTGDRPYRCELCGYSCSELSVLQQHKRTHTGEKPFPCPVCHKSFSASTALSVHMRTHTGFKPLMCKYPGCGKRFSESSNLAKHVKTHSEQRPFACSSPDCSKSFQRSDQLKRHMKNVHKVGSEEITHSKSIVLA